MWSSWWFSHNYFLWLAFIEYVCLPSYISRNMRKASFQMAIEQTFPKYISMQSRTSFYSGALSLEAWPSPFFCSLFFRQSFTFSLRARLRLQYSYLCLFLAGITEMHQHACWLRWDLANFLSGLSLNHDSLDLCSLVATITGVSHCSQPKWNLNCLLYSFHVFRNVYNYF
jgi:hypothetical protein